VPLRLRNILLAVMLVAAALPAPIGVGPFAHAPAAHAQGGLPALPAGWPTTLQLGRADSPGGAASMKAQAPFGFRYQYLAGGVLTGGNWSTWNENGHFATYYIQDSVAQGITPVFTYYMIYQSAPGGGSESQAVLSNLNNATTMQAYWANLKLFFQRAGAFPNNKVVLHVEPDMWGYVQHVAVNDNAASVPAKVGSAGHSELNGLPDNVAGLAQGIVRLRNQYAPNVFLGYQVSVWGTGVDISLSDPSDSQVDALGNRAGAFYTSLGAAFDVAFSEFSDRDSAFKQAQWGMGQEAWWNADDFRRHARFISRFVATSGKRMVMWQIPLGNTRMRAMNNTWNHYQDNRVEWLLDEPGRTHLTEYVNAGVIGFLFGRGADGVTCPCDAPHPNNQPPDGVTNPLPINGNTVNSYSADDDGGFFQNHAAAYYTAGAMSLPAGTAQPPTPTPPTPSPSPGTPTPTLPVVCSPRPPVQVTTAPAVGGLQVTVTATGQNNTLQAIEISQTRNALVDVGGQAGRTGAFTVTLPGTSASTSFTVRRQGSGAATVSLAVVDRCGRWTTFVGGGPGAAF